MKQVIRCTLMVFVYLLIANNSVASLLISPTKAIFDERDRVKEITLINTSARVNTYRIGWSEKKQTETSGYEELSPEDEASFRKASRLIRFSPKQVTLQPGGRQKIKMLLRKKSKMEEGDYRSHLTFTIIPRGLEEQLSKQQDQVMNVKLNVFINYSIPIVVRNGTPNETVDIVSLQAMRDEKSLNKIKSIKVDLTRSGNYGSYGRLELIGTDPETRNSVVLGTLNGFNFLHENTKLTQYVPIDNLKIFEKQSAITINYVSEIGSRHIITSKLLQL